MKRGRWSEGLWVACLMVAAPPAEGQPTPAASAPAVVRYTDARRHELRAAVTLPGAVEVPRVSTVAAELAGVVEVIHAREGSRVSAGAVMVGLRTTALQLQIDSLQAEAREADARRELAEREFDRARQLFARGILSNQQLEAAQYELRARQGRSDQLSADLAGVRDALTRSEIRAPFDGVVIRRHTELGQWVTAGGPVLEVQATGEFDVAVDVPERYYGGLQRGQRASVTFDALPGRTVRGRIVVVVPRATPQSGTFPVKLRLEGPGVASVAAGMLASVSLPIGSPGTVTIVPKDAITRDGSVQRVLIMDDDGKVRAADVATGAQTGAWVAVTGDVQPGMRVLTRGNERVRAGQVVTGQSLAYALP